MPIIYLSPSTQEFNYYVNGGTEEYYMNLLADKMVPYLDASGIRYSRNTPDMTAASSIAASNAGNYDLHFALHSNAAAGDQAGKAKGSIVFYYPTSAPGKRAAELVADALKTIYPDPNLVRIQSTTTLGEVAKVRAPGILLELAFHDNPEDAAWIKNNLDEVARILVLALTEYFDIPFFETENRRSGVVDVTWGRLNIRARPTTDAPILAQAPDGAPITIINTANGWHLVNFNGTVGYANADYITLL
ncbi:SH3 domain-containing protein [Lawsonibacter sp. LCP25S3_G6]|uniref:SH3 domain-containing protein n=1 Tax=unclassified Lawsonibacter TaxID=2617946 RepID=UPI003F9954FD